MQQNLFERSELFCCSETKENFSNSFEVLNFCFFSFKRKEGSKYKFILCNFLIKQKVELISITFWQASEPVLFGRKHKSMKHNLTYYQHFSDSHNEPQFKLLRAKYGWAGEGKYWALKNIIASSDNCLLDISNPLNLGMYAVDLEFNLGEFTTFLEFLCSRDCGLLVRVENYITTEDIQETFETVMKQRKASRDRRLRSLVKQSNGTFKLLEINSQ